MKKFPTAQLLFTDTGKMTMFFFYKNLLFNIIDSLCYWIPTEKDLYEEIKGCLDYMDFSNYAQNHPNYCSDNHLVPGFFKDEYGGKPIQEFVGLRYKIYFMYSKYKNIIIIRSKMYSIKGADGTQKSAAKGVSKHVREKVLTHEV